MDRRRFAKIALAGSIAALGAAGGAAVVAITYPRATNRGNEVVVPRDHVPSPGSPPLRVEGRVLLVNLTPGEGYAADHAGAAPGGLLAVNARCTHLHCDARWRDDYHLGSQPGSEWLVCPCRGGVFTKAGVRVFGPPPRSLDTIALRVTPFGDVIIDAARIREGTPTNPMRAVRWPAV
ncbi:MAG: hypothetical protein WD359_01460 [Dehalococcoidia bacterium]